MHNALIGLTYIAMVLSPCVVAQWGHLLKFKYLRRFVMTRAERFALRLEDARLEQEYFEAELAGRFAAPLPPLPFAMNAALETARGKQREAASNSPAFIAGQQLVALRLAQLQQDALELAARPAAALYADPMDEVSTQGFDLPAYQAPPASRHQPQARAAVPPERAASGPRPVGVPFSYSFSGTSAGITWESTVEQMAPPELPSRARDVGEAESTPESSEQLHERRDLSEAA